MTAAAMSSTASARGQRDGTAFPTLLKASADRNYVGKAVRFGGVKTAEYERAQQQFQTHDWNKDGTLSVKELSALLRRGDPSIKDEDLKELFRAIDVNKDGRVEFGELLDFLHPHGESSEQQAAVWRTSQRLRRALNIANPGPSDYAGNYQVLGRSRQGPRATIGRGPGHRDALETSDSGAAAPGPTSYDVHTETFGQSGPSASMGSGPGHQAAAAAGVTPGPGEYNSSTVVQHVKGGSYFGTAHEAPVPATDARRRFGRADQNHDGSLDFEEVCRLMRRGNGDVADWEVTALFKAMDVNADGKIELHELTQFLQSAGGSHERKAWRTKLRDAFDLSAGPGPSDYAVNDRAESRYRPSPAATMGRGPGHQQVSGLSTALPGPATYKAERAKAAISGRKPAASFGSGPAHEAAVSTQATPGPADYRKEKSSQDFFRRTCGGTFGRGPGHLPAAPAPATATPGPGSYRCDHSLQSHHWHEPAATIGKGPGHQAAFAGDGPGPAAYNGATRRKIPGGSCFGGPQRFGLPPLSPFDRR